MGFGEADLIVSLVRGSSEFVHSEILHMVCACTTILSPNLIRQFSSIRVTTPLMICGMT